MTNQSHPSPSGAKRRWFQFSLRWLLAIVFVANLFFAWYFYTPPRWDRVRLHVDADSVRVNGRKVLWQELESVLTRRIKRMRESGVELEAARVQISVNGEATYGDFKRAVKAAWDVGLQHVELKTSDGCEPFIIAPPSIEDDEQEDEFGLIFMEVPRFVIIIEADSNGKLVRMLTPDGVFNASTPLIQLHKDISQGVGKDSWLREHVEMTLECDDHLSFGQVAAVLEANTEKAKAGGPRIPIIALVWVRIKGYKLHGFDYMEDEIISCPTFPPAPFPQLEEPFSQPVKPTLIPIPAP